MPIGLLLNGDCGIGHIARQLGTGNWELEAGMNCKNCGGAMELHATRGYFFCRYCGSFHFPEATAADGIRVLGQPDAGAPCPACKARLATAILDEAHSVQYCANCRGALLSREMRRAWATTLPAEPVALERDELNRVVSCPRCASQLATHPYYGPGNVVIDTCATCDVVWLDFGELKQIVDAPGRDRGGRMQQASDPWRPDPLAARPLMYRGERDDEPGVERPTDLLGILAELLFK
jgi:Zn-finger nucleic acid-binding protein